MFFASSSILLVLRLERVIILKNNHPIVCGFSTLAPASFPSIFSLVMWPSHFIFYSDALNNVLRFDRFSFKLWEFSWFSSYKISILISYWGIWVFLLPNSSRKFDIISNVPWAGSEDNRLTIKYRISVPMTFTGLPSNS